jgi:hypothetical protein
MTGNEVMPSSVGVARKMAVAAIPGRGPPFGDDARQAVAALRGYAYQITASALAWLDLGDTAQLYLEVAEDYAVIANDALKAVQVKDVRSKSVTLTSKGVRDAIASFVQLVHWNPRKTVYLRYLTTASIGKERAFAHRPCGEAGLVYWRKAESNASVGPLRAILESGLFSESVQEFVRARNDEQLRAELIRRISWDCTASDITAVHNDLERRLTVLAMNLFEVPPTEARRLPATVVHHVLKKAILSDARCRELTRAELYEVLEQATSVSVPRARHEALLKEHAASIWQIIEVLADRVPKNDIHDRKPTNQSLWASEELEDAERIERCFTDFVRAVERFRVNAPHTESEQQFKIRELPEAEKLYDLLSELRQQKRRQVVRGLFTLSDGRYVSQKPFPDHELIRQLQGSDDAMARFSDELRQIKSNWLRSLDERLSSASVKEVLRIASALEIELELSRRFGERRILCLDTDVIVDFLDMGIPNKTSRPSSAFSFYLLSKPPLIRIAITPSHRTELTVIAKHAIRQANASAGSLAGAHRLRRLWPLIERTELNLLLDNVMTMRDMIELNALRMRTFGLLRQFRTSAERNRSQEDQEATLMADADAVAHVLRFNNFSRKQEYLATLVTTTRRLLLLPQTARAIASESDPDDLNLAIQDVYGPAFNRFIYEAGPRDGSKYLRELVSTIAEAKSALSAIAQGGAGRNVTIDRAYLPHLRQAIANFADILEPFHEQVARAVEEERRQQMHSLRAWFADLTEGRRAIDAIILETLEWLDTAP